MTPCKVHHIVHSQSDPCFSNSCLNLSQFTNNPTSYINSNTTLFFFGGKHYLDKRISVSNVAVFSMLSMNDTDFSSVIICNDHATFTFSNVDCIYISGLIFKGCGGNRVESVGQLIIEHTRAVGQYNSGTFLIINETSVNMATSSFLSNVVGTHQSDIMLFRYLQTTFNYPQSPGATLLITASLKTTEQTLVELSSQSLRVTLQSVTLFLLSTMPQVVVMDSVMEELCLLMGLV